VLTFGISIRQDIAMKPEGVFDAEGYAAVVVEAEQLGYDYVFAPDHIFVPPYMAKIIGDAWIEPLTLLSYLAGKTSRIELVVACLVVPYRQPFTTAETVATLDQVSGGRFALGIVPGYLREEFETFNLPLEERNAMTNEFVRIMIEVWSSDAASYQGKYYSCDGIDVKPKCIRQPHVPIWVGGSSRPALQRVVEFGNVWHPLGFTVMDEGYKAANAAELAGKTLPTSGTTPDRLRRDLEYLKGLADEAGRDLSDLQVVVLPGPPVDEEDTSLAASVEKTLRLTEGGDRAVDWLGRYVDAGATGFVVAPPGESLDECAEHLRRYAADVVPQLNRHAQSGVQGKQG
jgi:probable F420-dependent oxidoreductase